MSQSPRTRQSCHSSSSTVTVLTRHLESHEAAVALASDAIPGSPGHFLHHQGESTSVAQWSWGEITSSRQCGGKGVGWSWSPTSHSRPQISKSITWSHTLATQLPILSSSCLCISSRPSTTFVAGGLQKVWVFSASYWPNCHLLIS